MAKKRFSISMDEQLHKILEERKWKQRTTMNALIMQILWDWVNRNNPV